MGARDQYQSIVRVTSAFEHASTWKQAELARHVGISPRALRTILINLQEVGVPLESETDFPHVYWSVPKHWRAGGVFIDRDDVDVLIDAVLRIRDPAHRRRLLGRLAQVGKFRRECAPRGRFEIAR